jgi:hypothetical protein
MSEPDCDSGLPPSPSQEKGRRKGRILILIPFMVELQARQLVFQLVDGANLSQCRFFYRALLLLDQLRESGVPIRGPDATGKAKEKKSEGQVR